MLKKSQYRITEEGFKIKKLIGSRTIPFGEIRSIHLQDEGFVLTDYSGASIEMTENNLPLLIEAVVRHNISYLDETDREEKYYTREELDPLIEAATRVAAEVADDYVKEHLGQQYSVDTKLLEESAEINLLFILLCNGDVDTKLPPNVGDLGSDNTPGCFDWLAMAWLHEWDPSGRFARYGIVNELKDLEICRKSQLDSMKSVVEIIKRKNCP